VYDLIECYYDEHDNIIGWCDAGPIMGESVHELHGVLQRLLFTVTAAIVAPGSDPRRSLLTTDALDAATRDMRFDEDGEPCPQVPTAEVAP
jgi:hypothetical protein